MKPFVKRYSTRTERYFTRNSNRARCPRRWTNGHGITSRKSSMAKHNVQRSHPLCQTRRRHYFLVLVWPTTPSPLEKKGLCKQPHDVLETTPAAAQAEVPGLDATDEKGPHDFRRLARKGQGSRVVFGGPATYIFHHGGPFQARFSIILFFTK